MAFNDKKDAEMKLIRLMHYKQRYRWDCGISCVLMVLPQEARRHLLKNFLSICEEEEFKNSTWTIDLCYLLKRFNIVHKYLTVTVGINPNYHKTTFYNKILHKDQKRVIHRFSLAQSNNLVINQTRVKTKDILHHIKKHGPVIILTNARLLHCLVCKHNKVSMELRACLPWKVKPQYHGHYIVLCGYDFLKRTFYYRNPSLSDRICVMSFENMNEARTSFGTDEDTILIYGIEKN